MAKETAEFILPSNPKDRNAIKDAVYEIVALTGDIKLKRGSINDIKKDMKEKFQVPAKILTKMAKTYAEANIVEVRAENEVFDVMFETLFETNVGSTSSASSYSADDAE